MQVEGNVKFLKYPNNQPTCCAFHPKDRYVFVWGGSGGQIAVHNALRGECLRTITLATLSLTRGLNALTFTEDGTKLLATAASRRVSIIDVERGETVLAYDNCASPLLGRQPLVMHPDLPYLAACATVNCRGITLLDLRMPLPLDFIYDLHDGIISELCFVDGSWPWGSGKAALVSGSGSGHAKVSSMDGRPLCVFSAGWQPSGLTSLAPSPERYNASASYGYPSIMMASTEEGLLCWVVGRQPWKWEPSLVCSDQVTKMRYSYSGGLLFTANKNGSVKRFRRYNDSHKCVGELYSHSGSVLDLDISSYDEYLITTAQDSTIGLLRLGSPNHGFSQYYEFT